MLNAEQSFTDGRQFVATYDIRPSGVVYRNLDVESLYQAAVQRGHGQVLANGALLQSTAPYFGRAAKSSFYVRDPNAQFAGKSLDELIAWGDPATGEFDNLPISPEVYTRLRQRVIAQLNISGDLYVTDAWSGRTEASRLGVRVITERATSALFARNIFMRPTEAELQQFSPDWTILHAPTVEAQDADGTNGPAFIITDLVGKTTIIGGTRYHGQIKKIDFRRPKLSVALERYPDDARRGE